jgi:hypothetical protein
MQLGRNDLILDYNRPSMIPNPKQRLPLAATRARAAAAKTAVVGVSE